MVDISKFDITVLVTMTLAVIIMSFAFPAAGMAGATNETAESDIPELEINGSRFDFAGDFPSTPTTSTSGRMKYHETDGNIEGVSNAWVDLPKDDGVELQIQNPSASAPRIQFVNWSSGATDSYAVDNYKLSSSDEGTEIIHQNNSWTVTFNVKKIENYNDSKMNVTVDWEINDKPVSNSAGGGLSSVPVIGTLYDGGKELASVLAQFGLMIRWGVGLVAETALNLLGMLVDVTTFAFELLGYMADTYQATVSEANGWASVVLLVPAVLLFAEFAKIGVVAIRMLPTT